MHMQVLSWEISVQRNKPDAGELARRYDQLAQRWSGKIRRMGFDRAYRALFAELVAQLLPRDDHAAAPRVLDCGLGAGDLSLALGETLPATKLEFHGVDVSPGMVAEAERRFAEQGRRLRARVQTLCDLPYDDGSFDLVMSAHAIEHLPDPRAGLAEMARVLRPGAPLLVVTTRPSLPGRLLDAQWGLNCIAPTTLHGWLHELGLVNVSLRPLPGPPWCGWMSVVAAGWRSHAG